MVASLGYLLPVVAMNFKNEVQMFRSEDLHQWNYKNRSDSRLYTGSDVMDIHVLIIRVEILKFESTRMG